MFANKKYSQRTPRSLFTLEHLTIQNGCRGDGFPNISESLSKFENKYSQTSLEVSPTWNSYPYPTFGEKNYFQSSLEVSPNWKEQRFPKLSGSLFKVEERSYPIFAEKKDSQSSLQVFPNWNTHPYPLFEAKKIFPKLFRSIHIGRPNHIRNVCREERFPIPNLKLQPSSTRLCST